LHCEVDAGQLESALLNIAINSRDAMPDGGILSFACAPCVTFPPDVATELGDRARRGAFVEIVITDDGEGMTETVRERVFEPFFTTKELGRGTGLGMSTVYGFVKQSRGSIRLNTAPGAGTQVTLYLPRVRGTAELEDTTDNHADSLPTGLHVMLVEDDIDVRCVVEQFLLSLGCRVNAFDCAETALASLEAGEPCQLVLTDIALGAGMRGTELARRVQSRWPEMALLLMSGYSSELLQAPGENDAPWELLRKPYERADLARAITRAMKSRAPPGS
jgi:CheY-like chemotaxis protein